MNDLFCNNASKENILKTIRTALDQGKAMGEPQRVSVYNAVQAWLGDLVADLCPDPACSPRLFPVALVKANDYNPNKVAMPEMELLEQSMRADGITMAVVVMRDEVGNALVVDGFHRHTVASKRLGRKYIPCAVIDRPLADRMASTVRHNRARGKHQVDLMAALVKTMMGLGWDDTKIAESLGMSEEELLRLRQMVGAARVLAGEDYTRSWGVRTMDAATEGNE
jgi:ParB-like chromosome segregation protein Spo0J